MDNKVLMDLARQLGFPQDKAESKAKEYMGKSDEEIFKEIKKVKMIMKRDKKNYEKQLQTVKALAATMNGQQRARLEKIIELLES